MKKLLLCAFFALCIAFLMPEKSDAQFFPHNDTTYTFVSTTNAFGRIQTYDGEDGRYQDVEDKMIDRFYQVIGLNENYVWNPNDDPDVNLLDTLYYEGPDSLQYFRELIMDNSWRSNPPIDINVHTLVRMFKDDHYGLARLGVINVEDDPIEFQFSALLRAKIFEEFGGETLEYDASTGRIYFFNADGAIGIQALDREETGVALLDFFDYDSTDPLRDNARDFVRWDLVNRTTFDTQTTVGPDGGWAYMNFGSTGELANGESYYVWIAFTHGADLDVVDMRLDAAAERFDNLDDTDTSIEFPGQERPVRIALEQNYPNPFNPSTTIGYSIPETGHVTLNVYNALGQRMAQLVNGTVTAGSHAAMFDASNLSSGMYIYRLTNGGETISRTMMLVK